MSTASPHSIDPLPSNGPRPSIVASSEIPRAADMVFDDGTRAVAEYTGDPGSVRFSMTHLPVQPNGRGVLVCSPIFNDYLKNNRREVLIARRLARSGFTVTRFQYLGTNNSEGEILDLTMDTMVSDAEATQSRLLDRDGVEEVACLGTRMGGVVAATLAASADSPVALWEPIDGTRYFRELFRIMAIIEMNADGSGAAVPEIKAAFEQDGMMDSAGFAVSKALEESSDRGFVDRLGEGSAPVFLAQFREKPELKAEYAKAATRWTEHGRTVTEHHVLTEEAWMLFVYGFRAEEDRAHSQELIDATVTWFEGLS